MIDSRVHRAALPTLRVTFEVLSPMFLGGAAQGAELRVPSFRGALRAWLRALAPDWRVREGRLFGDTKRQGAVSLSVEHGPSASPWSWDQNKGRLRELFSVGRGPETVNGVTWLGFALGLPGNEGRTAIPAGATFTLCIQVFPSRIEAAVDGAPRDVWAIVGAVWALGHLGAMGMRSRRGFGSLQITSWGWSAAPASWTEAPRHLPLLREAADGDAAAAAVKDALRQLEVRLGEPAGDVPRLGAGSQTLVLPPSPRRPPDPSWAWAPPLQEVGIAFQTYRRRMRADKDAASTFLRENQQRQLAPVPLRVGFGLPLTFRFLRAGGHPGGSFELLPARPDAAAHRQAERWPSPVRIRLVRTRAGLHPLVLRTGGLRPASGPVRVRNRNEALPPGGNKPGRDVTTEFLTELPALHRDAANRRS